MHTLAGHKLQVGKEPGAKYQTGKPLHGSSLVTLIGVKLPFSVYFLVSEANKLLIFARILDPFEIFV